MHGGPLTVPEVPAAEFAAAFVATRKAAGLLQKDLAKRLGLSARSLIRWENGEAMPRVDVRDVVIGWLRSRSGADAERALAAMGALFARPAAAAATPQSMSPEAERVASLALANAIYEAAEREEIPPRAARQIAIAALEAAEAAGLAPKRARELLAAKAAKTTKEPATSRPR